MSALFEAREIKGVGIQVNDVICAARNYTSLLGVAPWRLLDIPIQDQTVLRSGTARLGSLNLELFQLPAAPGTMTPGIQYIDFGEVDHYSDLVKDLLCRGITVDVQVATPSGARLSLLDTHHLLGTRIQLIKPMSPRERPEPFVVLREERKAVTRLADREIVQLGIVVDDVNRVADNYSELFGIDSWSHVEFNPGDDWRGVYRDIPIEGPRFHIKGALAMHGRMQIELLAPVSGTSTHMDFLNTIGTGIHHLSFGAIDEHDEAVGAITAEGVGIEMAGDVGRGAWFTYLRTQALLGTIYEVVRSGS